ncbi:cysteine desulfurase sulfur acceptor subunit CsdE [Serratia microhaemolytica]|uniref:cysteine desulfurase sulfur acceptor subunit CsdE n=1 Tax=Serratia microhaemolytica TaxID=2675110 RepID=UPI000FDEA6AA|nr:cysteine desulfurase sulfur acceptor subunit CsdE [Serratia microhaemolytica]
MNCDQHLVAAHPFGTLITAETLLEQFNCLSQWEARYRQLILLAKQLPPLAENLRQPALELSGCESRVWFGYQLLADGRLHFYADSDSRIVRGLLAVLLTAIEGKSAQQLLPIDPLALFDQLALRGPLSTTRAGGLAALAQRVQEIAAQQ